MSQTSAHTYFCIGVNADETKIVNMSEQVWFWWYNLLAQPVPQAYASNGNIISSVTVQMQASIASADVPSSLAITQPHMSTVAINADDVLYEMKHLVATMAALYSASLNYDLFLGNLVLTMWKVFNPQLTVNNNMRSLAWVVFLPNHEKFKDTGDDVPGKGALLAYATYAVFINELEKWCAKQTVKCNLTVLVAAPRCDKTLVAVQNRLEGFNESSK